MYRILLLLTTAGLISIPVTAFADFIDVPQTHPNFDAINYLQEHGIAEGYNNGTFLPEKTINRAEFVKMLIANLYQDHMFFINACHGTWYADVPQNAWYISYLCRANDDHFVGGYPDRSFRPSQPINFAEAGKVMSLVDSFTELDSTGQTIAGGKNRTLTPETSGPWYERYVEYLQKYNAIPMSIVSFDQLLTRGEMAEILYRLSDEKLQRSSQTYTTIGNQSGFSSANPCTDPPVPSPLSSQTRSYPKSQKYLHLEYLGELLTAYDCGKERLQAAFGDLHAGVGPGAFVTLKKPTNSSLLSLLKQQGYRCWNEEKYQCQKLEHPSTVTLESLIELHPFTNDIESFSCPNCYGQ